MFGFRTNKLKPAWQYAAGGVLWRIVPTNSGRLVGETRDLEKKQVSFFCVNMKTGDVVWERETFGEQWWIGIEAVHNDTLLLHKFATPELPEHQSLIAVDILTGEKLWQDVELKLESMDRGVLSVSRRTPTGNREYSRLHVRSGKVAEEQERNDTGMAASLLSAEGTGDIRVPLPLVDPEKVDASTALALREHCIFEELVGSIEYIEQPRYLIFSYHERISSATEDQPQLNTLLKILDRGSGSVCFSETINHNVSGAVPESFFVKNDIVIYVHERTALTAIVLPDAKR